MKGKRSSNRQAASVVALIAMLAGGCNRGQANSRAVGVASRDSVRSATIEPDGAGPSEQHPDSLPLFHWSAAQGSRLVGHIPGDVDLGAAEYVKGAVGPGGILLWRYRDDAGDYIIHEPWLVRPGAAGRSLAEPRVYLYTQLAWLPGRDLVVMSMEQHVDLLAPSGRVMRELAVDPDTNFFASSMAVHPVDGRIAVVLTHTDILRVMYDTTSRMFDLAIMDPEGKRLALVPNVARPRSTDSFLVTPTIYWVAGGRIALMRELARGAVPTEGEGGSESGSLALVDPGRGVVEFTDVVTSDGIAAVDPDGRILLGDGRLYDPGSGELRELPLGDSLSVGRAIFSPDGRSVTALKWARVLGVLRLADGNWQELGEGTALGWAPDGTLYWVGGRR